LSNSYNDHHLTFPQLTQAVLLIPNSEGFSPLNHEERNLVLDRSERPCTQAEFNDARAFIDPTVRICSVGLVQWDEDGLLVSSFTFVSGVRINSLGQNDRTFYKGHYNNQECNDFGRCSVYEPTTQFLPNQYAYDSSNVYCGPNAIRDCFGVTQSVPCNAGTDPPTPIRTHAEVECDRSRRLVDTSTQPCGNCVSNDNGIIEYSCDEGCLGFDGVSCLNQVLTYFWLDSQEGLQWCVEYSASGDLFCVATVTDPKNGDGIPISVGCVSAWNGEECTCEICGQTEQGVFRSIDCSPVTGVSNSVFNECTGISSGSFDLINSLRPDACAAQEQTPVDPPVLGPPVAPVLPPMAPPIQNPVLSPTGSSSVQSSNVQVPVEAPVSESENDHVKDTKEDGEADSGEATTIPTSGGRGGDAGSWWWWWLLYMNYSISIANIYSLCTVPYRILSSSSSSDHTNYVLHSTPTAVNRRNF